MKFVIIKHSPLFWEVRPAIRYAVRRLKEIIASLRSDPPKENL